MIRFLFTVALTVATLCANAQNDPKLSGRVIGTGLCVDYNKNQSTTTVNTAANCFDGDLSTFFATYARNNTWAGLDLGAPYIITRVGWSPRNDSNGPRRVQLAVFEGANREDFSDAVPIYIVDKQGTIGTISHADLTAKQAFRYVRYVGPHDARCNVAELEFYGHKGDVVPLDLAKGEAQKVDANLYYRPTNLPVVVIHTENSQEPYDKTHEISSIISIISDGKVLRDTATIRLRGNGSNQFEKKPYRIKWDEKHRVLDSPAKAKKWTLINNYGDKTLMRNMLAFELSRRIGMPYTPFCTPVDVILNGEYKGSYQLCDQVEVHKGRVEIDEMDESCIMGDALTGGYFLEIDAYATDEPQYFWSVKGNPVTIKSPDEDVIQKEQRNYINNYYNDFENRLFSNGFTNDATGYRARFDLDSFLRHFIIGELSGNTDTYWSVFLYKPRKDAILHCGPVWDFDLAFDNDYRTHPINSKSDWVYHSGASFAGSMRNFVDRIIQSDSKAWTQLKALWAEARLSNGFLVEELNDYVDECAALLDQSQKLNFLRWPILNQNVHMNYTSRGSYAAEVKAVKDYIKARIPWIDKKLGFDATSIDGVLADSPADGFNGGSALPHSDDAIYTLSGQRAAAPLQPGIYVRNGRKIVIKPN